MEFDGHCSLIDRVIILTQPPDERCGDKWGQTEEFALKSSKRIDHLPIVSWTGDRGAGLVLVDGRLGKGIIDTS